MGINNLPFLAPNTKWKKLRKSFVAPGLLSSCALAGQHNVKKHMGEKALCIMKTRKQEEKRAVSRYNVK